MLGIFATARRRIVEFRASRHMLESLKELERETHKLILQGNPQLGRSLLLLLFISEVRQSRRYVERGNLAKAREFRDHAKKTHRCMARSARPLNRRREIRLRHA